jgi:hypothetical protein
MASSCFEDLGFEMNTARCNTPDVEATDASTSGPDAPLLIHGHADVEKAGGGMQGDDTPRTKAKSQALLVSELPLDLLRERAER